MNERNPQRMRIGLDLYPENQQMEAKTEKKKRLFTKSPTQRGPRKKVIAYLVVGVMLTFLFAAPVHATPSSHDIGMPMVTQVYPEWCWAACGASTVNYYGGNTTQSIFSYYAKGYTIIDYGTVIEVCNGLTHYSLHNHPYVGTMGFSAIQTNCYTQGRPALVALFPSTGSNTIGHMVAITGYEVVSGVGNHVILMDPAYSSYRYMTYAALVSSNGYSWRVTIDQIY